MKPRRLFGKLLLAGALPLLLASCAHVRNPQLAAHPLIGRVWDVSAQRFVAPSVVLERATDARIVLLGEIHDNAVHHHIQAKVLETLVHRGRRPALVMEQYDVEQQASINGALQGASTDAEKLQALADLMRKSWGWPFYEPIVRVAVREKLPLIAANLSRDAVRTVSRNGYQALGAGEAERLALEAAWTPQRQDRLLQELAAGHCGKMPEHMGDAIARAQRSRDAVMADMLIRAAKSGAVAIIGRSHARQDMGVPLYLALRSPDTSVLSVGLVEVDAPVDPAVYAQGPLGQIHDYLWFTPRTQRKVDPCDEVPAVRQAAG